jgi:DNA-binding transcriptional ArsR family regulator
VRDTARFFKALADEARLKILWLLFNHRELCVCDIKDALDITQSKASRHLAALRHAGLAIDRRDGLWCYYSICPVEDDVGRRQLAALRESLASNPDAALVLRELHKCMQRRGGDAQCTADGVCCAKTANKTARAPRARLAGEVR